MKVLEGKKVELYGAHEEVNVYAEQYDNGRLAIRLIIVENGVEIEPFGTLAVNMPDQDCPEGEVFIKDWSENEPWALKFAQENKIIEGQPTAVIPTGYVNVKRYRLHQHFFSLLATALHKEMKR